MVTLVLPNLFEKIGFDRIIDCVNGIICHYKKAGLNVKIGLWDPKTDEHKIIPPSIITNDPDFDAEVEIHGFGYDNVNDDYKVIQHICYCHNEFYQYEPALANWQIYSLKSNCWKKLNLEMTEKGGFGEGYVTYLNGVCHWRGGDKNGKEVLVSFNLSTETFRTTLIGWQQSDDIDCLTRTLVVLNDSVALISSFDENSHIEISILGEVGVKESWVKLFTVGPFPYIWHPIVMGNKCDIIFFMGNENHELASFDVISGKLQLKPFLVPNSAAAAGPFLSPKNCSKHTPKPFNGNRTEREKAESRRGRGEVSSPSRHHATTSRLATGPHASPPSSSRE
ncbi:F-box/kelch-repeat protein At3g06240-like [Arachis stenosperma]|uniref:F-box/kelch-repeat protein At3g06240-like n=1 Tax=Arachis stenosperma TaxID=217475 RepID=UPI0025AC3F8D|nr:F-box/kelch-repeat protein At3g06240-like [Arachis stenosperma]